MHVTVHLKQPTQGQRGPRLIANNRPLYLVLLRVGFTLPLILLSVRCALTAPFHPYHFIPQEPNPIRKEWRYIFCGTLRRFTPPRSYLAPCPLEPGLSSRYLQAEPIDKERLPGRLPRASFG